MTLTMQFGCRSLMRAQFRDDGSEKSRHRRPLAGRREENRSDQPREPKFGGTGAETGHKRAPNRQEGALQPRGDRLVPGPLSTGRSAIQNCLSRAWVAFEEMLSGVTHLD